MKHENILSHLLRKNISAWQIAAFCLSNFIGLTIIVVAFQFYRDIASTFSQTSAADSNFIVVTHSVGPFGATESGFSGDEIANIAQQPWVERIGNFVPANFAVTASINFNGSQMSTQMFLEGIDGDFLESTHLDWNFNPENPEIPLILSKDYLSLYNFGFASSRGLPAVSEAMIGMIPLQLTISGNGLRKTFNARVAGFTSRFNTIAVPTGFIEWANSRFGESQSEQPTRLIVETKNPGDPAIDRYLKDNSLETPAGSSSQVSYYAAIISGVVAAIGAIICGLSVFILLLSLFLLLQKNKEKIQTLVVLGYSAGQISAYYRKLVGVVNIFVVVATLITAWYDRELWLAKLALVDSAPASFFPSIILVVAIAAIITAINILTINRIIGANFRR